MRVDDTWSMVRHFMAERQHRQAGRGDLRETLVADMVERSLHDRLRSILESDDDDFLPFDD